VNPYLTVAALVGGVSLMFVLPLIPAIVELHRKSDALPLSVVQQNAGEIRYFSDSFRTYIKGLEPTMQRCAADGTTATGALPDGEEYVVLGRVDEPLILALQERDRTHLVMGADVDLILPNEARFSKDIYAGGQFIGGAKNNFRAILGEKNVHLGASTSVLRWVHAVGEFTAGFGCNLYGRISSDSLIRLRAQCSFRRLNAPRIEIGRVTDDSEAPLPQSSKPAGSGVAPRFLHDGDFEVQAGQVVVGDILIRGKLHIGAGARICGSVKSVEDAVIADGVAVEGSLISARRMSIGPYCTIHGPVIAERELAIATGARCGTLEHPTTVSATTIEIEEGAAVFGTLWAREHGQVIAGQAVASQ
jgi:cytoskeletal protein CcmA (bactofilin family)